MWQVDLKCVRKFQQINNSNSFRYRKMDCFYKAKLAIYIIFTLYPSCYSKCDNFYLVLIEQFDADFGITEYRPISKENLNVTLIDLNSNNTIDDDCVLDLSCMGISTGTESPITIHKRLSTDVRYTRPPEYTAASIYSDESSTFATINEPSNNTTTAIGFSTTTTVKPYDKPVTPSLESPDLHPDLKTNESNSTDELITGTSSEDINQTETATTKEVEIPIPTEEVTEINEKLGPTTVQIDDEKNNANTPYIELEISTTTLSIPDQVSDNTTEITVNQEPSSTYDEENNDVMVTGNSSVIEVSNTTDNPNPDGALLHGELKPEESRHFALKIVAGALGAVASVVVIYSVKHLIQNYKQSGAYHIPA